MTKEAYYFHGIMEIAEKIKKLEDKGFDWFEIADLISISYDEVRAISEESD